MLGRALHEDRLIFAFLELAMLDPNPESTERYATFSDLFGQLGQHGSAAQIADFVAERSLLARRGAAQRGFV